MAAMIYGSNLIESAGSAQSITLKLCSHIFAGLVAVPSEIPDNDPEFLSARQHLAGHGLDASQHAVLRSRREIIQHAKAWKHLLLHMVCLNHPLSEDLILKTHGILCDGVDLEDGSKASSYAGMYRTVNVCAGFNSFVSPAGVPSAMHNS